MEHFSKCVMAMSHTFRHTLLFPMPIFLSSIHLTSVCIHVGLQCSLRLPGCTVDVPPYLCIFPIRLYFLCMLLCMPVCLSPCLLPLPSVSQAHTLYIYCSVDVNNGHKAFTETFSLGPISPTGVMFRTISGVSFNWTLSTLSQFLSLLCACE